ncbi:MAG: manganese efflux pump [Planctomycetes bacterium]|nr:manganese efflux pump [Planctomycetota bacterium]
MSFLTILIIAAALAMDAFSVSIATGAAYKKTGNLNALKMAFFFGAFQAVMPIIGWLAGLSFRKYIESFDHWIAFALLAAVGGKMIYEAIFTKQKQQKNNPMTLTLLLVLSIATSIDALAVGITFSLIAESIAKAVIVIGLVTFAFSYIGVFIGEKLGHFFENKMEIAGGLMLLAIGIKILFEHHVFN